MCEVVGLPQASFCRGMRVVMKINLSTYPDGYFSPAQPPPMLSICGQVRLHVDKQGLTGYGERHRCSRQSNLPETRALKDG